MHGSVALLAVSVPILVYTISITVLAAGAGAALYQQIRGLKKLRAEYRKLRGDFTRANERAAGFRGEKAHILRLTQETAQPLEDMKAALDQLNQTSSLSSDALDAIQLMQEKLQAVRSSISALTEIQALEDRTRTITFGSVNVGAVLAEVVSSSRTLAAAKSIRLSLPASSKTSLARADTSLLRKVLSALIANAIEVSPQGSAVALSIYETNDRVLITVADEGPGPSVSDQAQLLSESGDSRPPLESSKGAPLNLAMIHNLVKAMEGWLWSQGDPGRGTTHVVELPLATRPTILPISASR